RPPRGSRECRQTSAPRLELRLPGRSQDGVHARERGALGREILAEVTAATLLPRERGARDERREQVRGRGEPPKPVRVAEQARVLPKRLAQLRCHGRVLFGTDMAGVCPQPWLVETRQSGAAAED